MSEARVRDLLAAVKPITAAFYRLTGKPLGMTGKIAEKLGLTLGPRLITSN